MAEPAEEIRDFSARIRITLQPRTPLLLLPGIAVPQIQALLPDLFESGSDSPAEYLLLRYPKRDIAEYWYQGIICYVINSFG